MRCRSCLLAVPLLLTATTLAGQDRPPLRDPQAVTILRQSIEAMGGAMALTQVQDMTVTADIMSRRADSQTSWRMRTYAKGLAQIRWEVDGPEGTVTSFFTARRAVVKTFDGTPRFVRGSIIEHGPVQFPVLYAAFLLTSPHVQIEMGNEAIIHGKSAYLLRIVRTNQGTEETTQVLSHTEPISLYVDKTSLLPLRLTTYITSENDLRVKIPVNLEYKNYQSAGGFLLPFEVSRQVGDLPLEEIRIRSVTFNTGLADSLFQ